MESTECSSARRCGSCSGLCGLRSLTRADPMDREGRRPLAGGPGGKCSFSGAVEAEPLPCAVMAAGDDAAALEASLLENMARLPADEMTQYECFARLVCEGKDVDAIAETFGLTRLMVERRLALGNLIPGIKALWRDEELDRRSLQHQTMATRAQQQDWLKLHRDPEAHAPLHHNLKDWLFGGESIPVSAAVFDVETCPVQVIGDLYSNLEENQRVMSRDRFENGFGKLAS